jgi:HAD superfamily hydrolase (TIGR01509 family)
MKAILFDIDGTLIDSNDYHIRAWDEVLRAAGHVFTRQELHDQIGKGGDNYVPSLLPQTSEAEADRLSEAHGPIYKERYLSQVRPFPGARDLMVRCRDAGLKVVLATSGKADERDHYVGLLDARDLIDDSTTADDVAHTKPCPDIFDTARRKVGVEASDALVIGDTPYDIAAAKAAGMATVAVRSGGFTDEQLAGAIAIYDDVAAILADFDHSPLARQLTETA